MEAIAYARYSSANQNEESITAQLRAIRDFSSKNKVQIIREYIDEAKSATTDDRPEFLRMFEDIETGKVKSDFVYVHKLDRFSRNRYDSAIYRRKLAMKNVKLIAVAQPLDDSPESVILEAMLEAFAEYYSKNLGRETMKGLKETALKAKHCGGIPPLGYDLDEDKRYIINENEAQAIRLIFNFRAAGLGYSDIIHALNARGLKTKIGKSFGKNSIHDILVNEKYTGTFIYNRASVNNHRKNKAAEEIIRLPEAIPQIVTLEEWLAVQKISDDRKQSSPRKHGNVLYLLTGKIFCGVCGGSYVGNARRGGRNKTRYYYYGCNRRLRSLECNNMEIRKEFIEAWVLDRIISYFGNMDINDMAERLERMYHRKYQEDNIEIRQLRNSITGLEQKIDRYYEAIGKGLDIAKTSEKINALLKKKEGLEMNFREFECNQQTGMNKEQILDYLQQNRNTLIDLSDPNVCKKLINSYVEKVVISQDEIRFVLRLGGGGGGGRDGTGEINTFI